MNVADFLAIADSIGNFVFGVCFAILCLFYFAAVYQLVDVVVKKMVEREQKILLEKRKKQMVALRVKDEAAPVFLLIAVDETGGLGDAVLISGEAH